MLKLDFTIKCSGNNWVVENEDLLVIAPTLHELDEKLKNQLLNSQILKKGKKAKLMMYYDNATIPEWIRQYAQHYFNRIVEVEG